MNTKNLSQARPSTTLGMFSTGMALFAMFFGAGNLIFPLLVGRAAGSQVMMAIAGLSLSAIAFPFLGLMAMTLFQGDLKNFLSRMGTRFGFCLLLVLQITLGPLCISRLFAMMHASVKPYFPVSLSIFSVLCGIVVFLFTFRPRRIVAVIGKWLTPFFLVSLAALIIIGMWKAPAAAFVAQSSSTTFFQGFKGGYFTMDLLSSLLFSTLILPQLFQEQDPTISVEEKRKNVYRKMIGASLIAAALLMATYAGLCWLSAHYSSVLDKAIPPEDLLRSLAMQIFGAKGALIAAVAIFFACFTTAIALASVFARYLRKELLRDKISSVYSLGTTLVLSGAAANLGFSGLLSVLNPILEILYPSLILLCLLNIGHRLYEIKTVKAPIFFALGFSLGGFCFG